MEGPGASSAILSRTAAQLWHRHMVVRMETHSGLGTDWSRWVGTGKALGKETCGVLGWGISYLGAPGWMIRIGPRVCVKGPASSHFRPTGHTSRLGGADIRPREGSLVPGGFLMPP